jgi:hypothetical protein
MNRIAAAYGISLLLALLRIGGMTDEIFQAVAHCWVGGLIGYWLPTRSKHAAEQAMLLTAVEVVCFVISRL